MIRIASAPIVHQDDQRKDQTENLENYIPTTCFDGNGIQTGPEIPSSQHEEQRFYENDFDGMAEDFVSKHCSIEGDCTLFYFEGNFHLYNGRYYESLAGPKEKTLTDLIRLYRKNLSLFDKRGKPVPTSSNKSFYVNFLDALRRLCLIAGEEIKSFKKHDPDLLFGKTKIYRISTDSFEEYNHRIRNTYVLGHDAAETDEEPEVFTEFFPKCGMDEEQERSWWMQRSAILMRDKSHNRIFYNFGNPRSGKTTTMEIDSELLGKEFVASLPRNIGSSTHATAVIVDKSLLTCNDMKFDKSVNPAFVQILLNLVGEDPIPIDEKYCQPYSYVYEGNVEICSNEIPNFKGNLSGLEKKFVFNVFYRDENEPEDLTLKKRMLACMPQIFRKAARMYPETVASGYDFDTPQGLELAERLADGASVEKRFVDETCMIGERHAVGSVELYENFREYAKEAGEHISSIQQFTANLLVLPELFGKVRRTREYVHKDNVHKERIYVIHGLASYYIPQIVRDEKTGKYFRSYIGPPEDLQQDESPETITDAASPESASGIVLGDDVPF